MVLDSQNRVGPREITLGIQTSNYAEVLSGLRAGERVVLSDRSVLKPGDEVKPQNAEVMSYAGAGSDR
jgi:hypothetical protein